MKSGEVFCPFLKRSLAEHASPVEFHASCHETSVFILFRDAPNFSFIIVQKVCRMSIDEKSLKISKISLVFKKMHHIIDLFYGELLINTKLTLIGSQIDIKNAQFIN